MTIDSDVTEPSVEATWIRSGPNERISIVRPSGALTTTRYEVALAIAVSMRSVSVGTTASCAPAGTASARTDAAASAPSARGAATVSAPPARAG